MKAQVPCCGRDLLDVGVQVRVLSLSRSGLARLGLHSLEACEPGSPGRKNRHLPPISLSLRKLPPKTLCSSTEKSQTFIEFLPWTKHGQSPYVHMAPLYFDDGTFLHKHPMNFLILPWFSLHLELYLHFICCVFAICLKFTVEYSYWWKKKISKCSGLSIVNPILEIRRLKLR